MESEASLSEKSQDEVLNAVLDALLYEDGSHKPYTRSLLELCDRSKSAMGIANALFVEGIIQVNIFDPTLFLAAERKGCQHPMLYHFLGHCFSRSPGKNHKSRVLDYFAKLFDTYHYHGFIQSGGYMIGHYDIYDMHENGDGAAGARDVHKVHNYAYTYYCDLEREGYVDGGLFAGIAASYKRGGGYNQDNSMSTEYYERSASLGWTDAFLVLSRRAYSGDAKTRDKALLLLLEAEEKGIRDDRILDALVDKLRYFKHTPCQEVLGRFKSKCKMMLHYCYVLIHRKSPKGYYHLGFIYSVGIDGIKPNKSKAVAVWKEADRVGLANTFIYQYHLSQVYIQGNGVPQNNAKALEYWLKILELKEYSVDRPIIYKYMAEVYEKGSPPIKKDPIKAEQLRRLAFVDSYD